MTRLATHRNTPVVCESCGRSVQRAARQQRFCSDRCREKARERVRKAGLSADTGAPATPPKLESKNNDLPTGRTGSSLFANAPLNLLGGGSWRWPGEPTLDGKLLAKIRHSEVGGELLAPRSAP